MDASNRILLLLISGASALPLSIYAADNNVDVKREIAQLKNQIQSLEMRIASADQTTDTSASTTTADSTAVPADKKPSTKVKTALKKGKPEPANNNSSGMATNTPISPANILPPFSWQGSDISALIVGGASAGYSKPSGNYGSFNILDFNPIFLFSYKESVFLRSSVDFSVDDYANTDVGLNYANINLFLTDYIVLGIGSFDSALGYFSPNLAPAWINRMPDAPVGFNADQAAPQAEVGMRLQGGFPVLCTMKANYILFISNGDQAFVDTTNLVIDHIGTDGYTNSFGNYVYGGRLGFLPITNLEIGVSAAEGKLTLLNLADGVTQLQRSRPYHVLGTDISFKPGNWEFRGEYIQQLVSSQSDSIVPQGQKWRAWYAEAAYWFPGTKFEPVVRYSKFTAPAASQEQQQWAIGLDYWIAPSIVGQASFERNKGQAGSDTNDNLFLIQLAFGY
jgi:hypothetical protein